MIFPFRALLLVTVTALFPTLTQADADGEREQLARLVHELEALQPLLKAAQSQADPDARIRFEHTWLAHELDRVKRGVEEHIKAPQTHPRQFPALQGDYRH